MEVSRNNKIKPHFEFRARWDLDDSVLHLAVLDEYEIDCWSFNREISHYAISDKDGYIVVNGSHKFYNLSDVINFIQNAKKNNI